MIKNFAQEFKAFALKGNMIDLAVAVVIGTAFGKVIESLVKNVITPLIPTRGADFSALKLGPVNIGLFINDLLSFLILAVAVFIVIVKVVGWLSRLREKPEEAPPPPPLTPEEQLLTEIRDLLRAR